MLSFSTGYIMSAALMVALFLNHRAGTDGLSKESLMLLAEETGISKESMDAKNGRYDGWAGMKVRLRFLGRLDSIIKFLPHLLIPFHL